MEVLRRLCSRRDLLLREIKYWNLEAIMQTVPSEKRDCLKIVAELSRELRGVVVRIKKLIASN